MKQILYILGLAILLSGISTSCKETTLEALHQDEVNARDKYVKDNNLTDALDPSGIYFKTITPSSDTTKIRTGFQAKLNFKITLLDGTVVLSTDDGLGHNFEPYTYYVDNTNATIAQQYPQQISGLNIGLKKMKVGETAFMVIPSELAFKAVDTSTGYVLIPRFSTLLATVYIKSALSPAQLKENQK
jgi:FKBP-type peptidyl-prolyl cis-trans isomerase